MTRRTQGWVASVLLLCSVSSCAAGHSPESQNQGATALRPSTTVESTDTVATPSVIAQATVSELPVFQSSDSITPLRSFVNPIPSGAPLVLLVRDDEQYNGRVEVYLPVRPNGSTGWLQLSDVELRTTDYRITVDLSEHRLSVRDGNTVMLDTPAGVGRGDTPTPGGVYFIIELLQPPDPSGPYGPYAYGLSGYSEQLRDFAGGTGVIGIHGTNDPRSIGLDVSHGCIRVSNEVIVELASIIPLGTPVTIVR